MKRKEVEKNLADLKEMVVNKIVSHPLPAFIVGMLVGAFVISNRGWVVPLILISGVVVVGLWVFSESEEPHLADSSNE